MTSQAMQGKEQIESTMANLLQLLTDSEGRMTCTDIEVNRLQELLAVFIKMYCEKVKMGETELIPVSKAHLNGTEAAIFTDQLLKSMNIELFELQMWRSMGSNY